MPVNNSTFLYGVAKWIVDPVLGRGTQTTIAAAISASSAGDTIFIRPGIYTENFTLKSGVSLTAFTGDAYTPNVTIIGKITISSAGNYTLNNLKLQTNSDFALEVIGSGASVLQCNSIYLNCSNNTGISFTNSNAGAVIVFRSSTKNLVTTGIAAYNMTSPGNMLFFHCDLQNTGLSTTAANNSAGGVLYEASVMSAALSSTGTGSVNISQSRHDCGPINATCVTNSSSAPCSFYNSEMISGTASVMVINGGSTSLVSHIVASSSNTNVFTGAGTLNYAFISFVSSSSGHNVTTETALNTLI